MKAIVPAILAAAFLGACAQLPWKGSRSSLVLEDAERFAALFADGRVPDAPLLKTAYLDRGTPGVAIFTPNRIQNAENLAKAVAGNTASYRRAISVCLPAARQMQDEASAIIARIGAMLGEREAATAYVVFGAGNSGGTAGAEGLVLGLEVICSLADTAPAVTQVLRDFIAHEMAHVYQSRAGLKENADDLLHQSMVEGFADFVMERALEGAARTGAERQVYGLANEAALWREFKSDVDSRRAKTEWLYVQRMSIPGRPADMGYWIGKRICEAYYAKAGDKRAAMRTLLELRDPKAILAESGYGLGFPR
ncbi:MAG TPA: DUF2268 domain-containing putative Zn-dependent protease [Usitatibacteraceae bacterium]|nr:DUF2268 domain-containing putative Zn-dependent protease [Usitatibacteraceae bacterium]